MKPRAIDDINWYTLLYTCFLLTNKEIFNEAYGSYELRDEKWKQREIMDKQLQ